MSRIEASPWPQADADPAGVAVAPAAPAAIAAPGPEAELRARATAAAEKFEGFFIAHMLQQMRSSAREFAAEGSVFKDPVNADMLGMADGMLADKMAGQHAFGIADAILRQLLPPASAAAPAPTAAARFNAAPGEVASHS